MQPIGNILSICGFLLLAFSASGASQTLKIEFHRDVQPIFQAHCFECHGSEKQKSDLRLDLKKPALAGGSTGPVIIPGKSAESLIIKLVSDTKNDQRMPPKGEPLSADQIQILRTWIDQGANWPDENDASGQTPAELHWSLKPVTKPPVPQVTPGQPSHNTIDLFVQSKLHEKGLQPSPPADPRTLLRRVYFDLTGLPPRAAEMDTFLSDHPETAYERVVDQLLASPRYGERFARHWMDIIHFAETHGHDQDRIRTNAWPYRDYLIQSFNEDKPYAQFIQEQLAGDSLFPDNPMATVALGFIAAGPWDESSLRDIREDTVDRQIARYLDRDDMIATTMSTFMSTTVHCARCHNHKFDPIPQKEYYNLQAVFAGIDRANRVFDPDPNIHVKRQALLKRKRLVENPNKEFAESLLEPKSQEEIRAWASETKSQQANWSILQPDIYLSTDGSNLRLQVDNSILSTGPRPDKDTYTVSGRTSLSKITAVRLEVLADESLPEKGPGRRDNGNFHLSEFKLNLTRSGESNATTSVGLQNPSADFNQEGWTIAHALDGKESTAWGIHPRVGKSHVAVFELKQPITLEVGSTLEFILDQKHGGGHIIGRFRLSVTDAPLPVRVDSMPESIRAILAADDSSRSREQQIELASYYLKQKIEKDLRALPSPHFIYAGASDFAPDGGLVPAKGPRLVHLLRRGDIHQPAEIAHPGALSLVPMLSPQFDLPHVQDEGTRRAALAKWIIDTNNVLTWRSIVNRVWQQHFGRGIVETPNDFGRMGASPSHPELLDWLAATFIESGGSLKRLHKLIVMSSTYRQSSKHHPSNAALDAGNVYLWRMNRTRLDAESVRDAVLQIAGKLDLTMGGPSVQHFALSPGIHVTPVVDYSKFDVDSRESSRRSIYRFLFRTLPDPLMDSLDCPDGSQLMPVRSASFTALQALTMLNSSFFLRQSEHFAERVRRLTTNVNGQIDLVFNLALGRYPEPDERSEMKNYVENHGLANLCRLIWNSNEFMFIN